MKQIKVISHLFPSLQNPVSGKFILDQIRLFEQSEIFNFSILVPTPYSIPYSKRWHKNKFQHLYKKISTKRTSYLSVPNRAFPRFVQKRIANSVLKKLRKEENKPDLIHLHWLHPDGMCIPELKNNGFKCILTIHGSDWYKTYNNTSFKPVIDEIFDTVNWVLFSGPTLEKDILKIYPKLVEKSSVIYNSVDSEKYRLVSPKEKADQKRSLKWDPQKKHVLTVAKIAPVKGVDVLVESIKEISYSKKDVHFHIIGIMNESDEFTKKVLSKIDKDLITIHPPVSPEELINYYQAADFYCLPSRNEGFNVSLLEATSIGLPIVCTDVGSNDIIVTKKVGLICEPENPSALAKCIDTMIGNFSKYDGSQISKLTLDRFSEKSMKSRLEKVYNNVLEAQLE